MPDVPGAIFRAGNEVAIPIIIGNTSPDGDLKSMEVQGSPKASAAAADADATSKFAGNSDSQLTKDDEAAIQEFFGTDADAGLVREALSLYGAEAATDGADGSRAIEFRTDRIKRCGSRLIATWHSRKSRTWEYQFSHGYEPLGTVHSWDQQYVFGIMIPHADQPADRVRSEAIERYRTNFAKTGDPNGDGLPAWPEVGTPISTSRQRGRSMRPGCANRPARFSTDVSTLNWMR